MTLPVLIPVIEPSIHSAATAFVEAIEVLAELPDSPEKIAKLFEDIGIKGVPCSGSGCVLVEYVCSAVWPETGVEVKILADSLMFSIADASFIYDLPSHFIKFIRNFDDLEYPNLIGASDDPR